MLRALRAAVHFAHLFYVYENFPPQHHVEDTEQIEAARFARFVRMHDEGESYA